MWVVGAVLSLQISKNKPLDQVGKRYFHILSRKQLWNNFVKLESIGYIFYKYKCMSRWKLVYFRINKDGAIPIYQKEDCTVCSRLQREVFLIKDDYSRSNEPFRLHSAIKWQCNFYPIHYPQQGTSNTILNGCLDEHFQGHIRE